MTADNFRKLEAEFLSYAEVLLGTAEDSLRQAREALEDPARRLPDCTPEQMAELCMRKIGERLEDLMSLHDKLQAAIGMGPSYAFLFEARRLSREGKKRLQEILTKYAPES